MKFELSHESQLFYKNKVIGYKQIKNHQQFIGEAINKTSKPIAVLLQRDEYLIMSILSLIELNMPYVPIDSGMPTERVQYILNELEVELVLMNKNSNHHFEGAHPIYVEDAETHQMGDRILNVGSHSDTTFYIRYTSGSSGKPKGVEITRRNIESFIEGVTKRIEFKSGSTILCHTTPAFDIFFLEGVMPFYLGLNVHLVSDETANNPKKLIEVIDNSLINMIQMTPSKLMMIKNYAGNFLTLNKIDQLMVGGETFPKALLSILQNETDANIYNMYGPTETTIWSSIADLTSNQEISIGYPIEHAELVILDNNNLAVPTGVTGQIGIVGDVVSNGYINNQSLQSEKFIELEKGIVCYLTGDYGYVNELGEANFLYRIDNQVKMNGYRIELEEIEKRIVEVLSVDSCVVAKIENNDSSSIGCLYIGSADRSTIESHLKTILPDYMIPNHYQRVDQLPLNANGKIDRKKIQFQKFDNCSNASNGCEAEHQSATMERLVEVINDVYDVDVTKGIGNETTLSEFGINSVSFIKLIVEIEEEFDFEFDDDKLSHKAFNSLKCLVAYIDEKTA